MTVRNVLAEARRTGTDANFVVADAASITKPAVTAVVALNPRKFCWSTHAEAHHRGSREIFGPATVQSDAIHAMVAVNERWAALWSSSKWSGRGAEEGQHSQISEVHVDDDHRVGSRTPRVDRDQPSVPSFFFFLFASGTRPRRRPRVHGTRGAHARSAAAYKRPTGRIWLRRRWAPDGRKEESRRKEESCEEVVEEEVVSSLSW